ncbi:unnamed protein product [Brassicogethes aeneus]|uniref:Uncharacterized protein n=1 Tax=Brassicogethes aeneus TaxID=1431903 RepID=A0A9P0BI99_BRAAE|nr:unnamed protein product [Brassicogethes aeneus]
MKNVSWVLLNILVISAALNITEEQMPNRKPKFYGPLIGAFLANLLAIPITAKILPQGTPVRLTYDPHQSFWNPHSTLANSYGAPNYYPTLTTGSPQIHHHHHHGSKPGTSQQQIVTIHKHPDDVVIDETYPDVSDSPQSTIIPTVLSHIEEIPNFTHNPSELLEPLPAESTINERRVKAPKELRRRTTTQRPKQKRGTQRYYQGKKKHNNNNNKRRKYTTTENYYDSYEEYTTKKPRRKSHAKRPAASLSYEDSDSDSEYDDYQYEESYEYTTRRPYKKRRRTTTRRTRYHNKNKKRQDSYDYDNEYNYNYREPFDTINVRPRQETTTETSTTTTTDASTTQATTITNGTTSAPNGTTNATGYGYGPSNGNENISITYGPPTGGNNGAYGPPRPSYGPPRYPGPQYVAQYSDWYESEPTRNSVVQNVHDLIGLDNIFQG